ncbi:Uncharacterized protein Fot_52346 [Forsythia ovata]|uniref:Uncharacterized protein n=1 Tax=Forsythia ovata TaxID=205694 RepID=A0ABD1PKG3_9LAMI
MILINDGYPIWSPSTGFKSTGDIRGMEIKDGWETRWQVIWSYMILRTIASHCSTFISKKQSSQSAEVECKARWASPFRQTCRGDKICSRQARMTIQKRELCGIADIPCSPQKQRTYKA